MDRTLALVALALCLCTCVDPTVPDFDYTTGFLLVDGRIANLAGESSVTVSRSEVRFGDFVLVPLREARVFSVEEGGETVAWSEGSEPGTFSPPADFTTVSGRAYHLRVETAEGERIESVPEVMRPVVPIREVRIGFEQEAYYSTERERFVPAFSLLADVEDPAETDNFYQFRYRTFERTSICKTCYESVYRQGECVRTPRVDYYDYLCDGICWLIERSSAVTIYSDRLSEGGVLRDVIAGRVDYTGTGGKLALVEMASLSPDAFTYLQQLDALTEGSGGLNAPLPAPLYGNLRDRSEAATNVLGYVAVAALDTARIYWVRNDFMGTPVTPPRTPQTEPLAPSPPAAPCSGPNFTSDRPTGWPN